MITRKEIVERLQRGWVLCIDQATAPELDIVRDLNREGLVMTELIEIDEQSTVLKVRWKKEDSNANL